ncbi:MAG: alkaline phosphatase family protein [Candidatus Thorarchaeota archaeon]
MTFVIICLDGFRYDYITKTEFIRQLLPKSIYGKISHGFGYASEYSAITGRETEELGIIANFFYNPHFNLYSFLGFLDNGPLKKQLRLVTNLFISFTDFLKENKQPKSIFNIPYKSIKYFDNSVKRNIFQEKVFNFPTFFELLRHKDISAYMWPFVYENRKSKIDMLNLAIDTANTDERTFRKSISLLKKNPDICYIHFFSTDNLVHKFGVDSKKTLGLIKRLDYYVKEILPYADKLLIYSDHGMVDVKETIDIKKIMTKSELIHGTNYIMFLDDTLARFWVFDKNTKNTILKILKKTKKGRFINLKDENLHKKFGEIIFITNPGTIICPNFYQSTPHKATHGYDDKKTSDEKGIYIFYNPQTCSSHKKDIKMKDIFRIIMEEAE